MRRAELIEGVQELYNALVESDLEKLIDGMNTEARQGTGGLTSQILNAFNLYSIRAKHFSPAAQRIAEILELSNLTDATLWLQVAEGGGVAYRVSYSLNFAKNYLPALVKLVQQEPLKSIKGTDEKAKTKYRGMGVLSVTVFEQGDLFSSPARLANVLESIDLFYTSCALMSDQSPNTLSVIACDSGSDKSFDFLGIAKLMECVTKIIESLWDRVIFYKEHQFEERLDLITKALPIIVQINKLEEEKQMEPERAEILRRNIFEASNKFIQSGATIPQIESKSHYDARSLMSPVQKLLASPSAEQLEKDSDSENDENRRYEEGSSNAVDFNKLNENEQVQLRQLFEKAKGKDFRESSGSIKKSGAE